MPLNQLPVQETLVIVGGILLIWSLRRQQQQSTDLGGFRETIRELRSDLASVRKEVVEGQAGLVELAERVDFAERVLGQVRELRVAVQPPATDQTPG